MTKEEIKNEMKRLSQLEFSINAKTKDGVQIKIGNTYYVLENLSEGYEEITLTEATEFQETGLREKSIIDQWDYSAYYNYNRLFSSKEAAYSYMEKYLNDRVDMYKRDIKSTERSLELLEKWKP